MANVNGSTGIEKSAGTGPNCNRMIFHPSFNETVRELEKRKIRLPSNALESDFDFSTFGYPKNGELVSDVEALGKFKLNCKNGQGVCNNLLICAYDESINKFGGLQGTGFLTSHSMIVHGQKDYIPANLLTFYFYTRSSALTEGSEYIKFSDDFEADSKKDYVADRNKLLVENAPQNSVLFIDGPLIGGQMTRQTLNLNKSLLEKDIMPIFFVKNSNSNLVVDNVEQIRGRFNSDLHWAYSYLRGGERTNFFRYTDKINPSFTKIFCYLKAFDWSPSRIEIDVNTYNKYRGSIGDVLNLIYYLLIVQGDFRNPQIRPIAIAEKFARESLKLINFIQMMKDLGITPTMNQERFAW